MTGWLRVRPLVLAIVTGALLVTLFAAHRSGRSFLTTRLETLLPAEDVARLAAEFSGALVVPVLVAVVAAILATLLLGALIYRPLRRLRSELRALDPDDDAPLTVPALHELRAVVAILERRRRELQQSAATLASERDEFALLVAVVSEGILQVSSERRIVYANPAARWLLGLPDNVSGQPLAALVRNGELRLLLEQAVAGGVMGSCEVSVDERRLLVAARPVPQQNGSIAGVVVALTDLTELRRLEEVRRDFVANVSHELKTPLTSIRGYVETVLSDELPAETQHQFLEVVRKNAERLQHIVDDLLDLSRLESGGWRPELQRVSARDVATDAWSGCRQRAGRKTIHSELTGDAAVLADADGLRQVLSNLFDNAIRYTPEGGRIAVRIGGVAGDRVAIEVADNGTGIPGDALPRIFERFYRVDPARSRAEGGTGLGLSIVRHLVERMGGSVTAQSELGKGTTIRVVLPAG
jgi:two-component system, OmpR family, phosphate regulon sensor histidine kinase PhoR